MTVLDAMRDPALFSRWFSAESWNPWRVFLAALFALPMSEAEAALYAQCTGRATPPAAPAREAWVIAGRRGGKSRVAALVAVFLACFRDYREHLAPGEVATIAVIAADRRQARVVMRYIVGFLESVPMLQAMIMSSTKETIELSNRTVIEIHTASFKSTRGYTLGAVIADEIAFWGTDEAGANPDIEIINGLRPGMASIPGALLLAISSPYARKGALWEAYRRHFGADGAPVLVWQADTLTMNASVDAQVIADAYAADDASAAAEYGAQFRRDVETYVSRETIAACVIPHREVVPYVSGTRYRAFADPSGGSADSFTIAIAHDRKDGSVVVDAIAERRPPFSPDDVVQEFAALLKSYAVSSVNGDRYAGEWPRERFRVHGIRYDPSDRVKSDIYRDLLPLLNAERVELLDNQRLIAQICGLERRTSRAGKDSIDHGPRGHDDVANAVAGAVLAARRPMISGTGTTSGIL